MIKYKNFNIYGEQNELVVFNIVTNEEKRKTVENTCTFTFKILKTKIQAIDGIDGTCWVDNIIKGM